MRKGLGRRQITSVRGAPVDFDALRKIDEKKKDGRKPPSKKKRKGS